MKTTESYQTNDMVALKREALVNKDIDTLQNIRTYEEYQKASRSFYVRENEEIIRDDQGRQVAQSELPFTQDENSLHLAEIFWARPLTLDKEKPGELIRDIEYAMYKQEKYWAWIFEVPAETVFPIPGGHGWWTKICLNYIASGKYVRNRSSWHLERLDGHSEEDKKQRNLWRKHVNTINNRTIFELE